MLESRGRVDEHYAVDGECRGGNRATKRDDPRDDRSHSALLASQSGAIIRRAANATDRARQIGKAPTQNRALSQGLPG
jgi:hypothetical protein